MTVTPFAPILADRASVLSCSSSGNFAPSSSIKLVCSALQNKLRQFLKGRRIIPLFSWHARRPRHYASFWLLCEQTVTEQDLRLFIGQRSSCARSVSGYAAPGHYVPQTRLLLDIFHISLYNKCHATRSPFVFLHSNHHYHPGFLQRDPQSSSPVGNFNSTLLSLSSPCQAQTWGFFPQMILPQRAPWKGTMMWPYQ